MQAATLRKEEAFGLTLAVAAHVALFAWLALGTRTPASLPLPERMTVTLSEDVALQSTSPEPAAAAAPDTAPALAKAPPEPVLRAAVQPLPRQAPAPRTTATPAIRPPGASRIGSDFLKGVTGASANGTSQNSPAATIGPAVRSAIGQAIARQLKPHWTAPQGPDVEQLVSVVRFRLNRDGTLAGNPEIVRQSGETPANRTQTGRHAEQAIRAVRLAAPFNLPEEFYSGWQTVTSNFDRRLSQ